MDTEAANYLADVAKHAHDQAALAAEAADGWQRWADQLAALASARPNLPTLRDPESVVCDGRYDASAIPLHLEHLNIGRTVDRLHRTRAEADAITAALRRAERHLRRTAWVAENTAEDERVGA